MNESKCVLVALGPFVCFKEVPFALPMDTKVVLSDVKGAPVVGKVYDVQHYLKENMTICRMTLSDYDNVEEVKSLLADGGFSFDRELFNSY